MRITFYVRWTGTRHTTQCTVQRGFCASGNGDDGDASFSFVVVVVCKNNFQSDFDVGQKFGALKAWRRSDWETTTKKERRNDVYTSIYLRPISENSTSISIKSWQCQCQCFIIISSLLFFASFNWISRMAKREDIAAVSPWQKRTAQMWGLARIIFNWLETLNANYSCGR